MTLSTVSPSTMRKLMTAVMSCGITLHAALPPWIIVGAMVVVTNGKRSGEPMQQAAMASALPATSCTSVLSGSCVI